MFTVYLTVLSTKQQYTLSHPKLATLLQFVRRISYNDHGATLRVWSSNGRCFVI